MTKDNTEFSSQSKEVENRYQLCSFFLKAGFVPYIPEYDSGVDFILYRESDDLLLKLQLKSRWTVDRKYLERNVWIAFPNSETAGTQWYVVPHDSMVEHSKTRHSDTLSWEKGLYHKAKLPQDWIAFYEEFTVQMVISKCSKSQLELWTSSKNTSW